MVTARADFWSATTARARRFKSPLREFLRTDNGSEFRARDSVPPSIGSAPPALHPRRPIQQQRLHRTRPTHRPRRVLAPRFARSLVPKSSALRQDLDEYLNEYNYDRAHTGHLAQGSVPADIVYGARKTTPGR
jgi:hypothetical protein